MVFAFFGIYMFFFRYKIYHVSSKNIFFVGEKTKSLYTIILYEAYYQKKLVLCHRRHASIRQRREAEAQLLSIKDGCIEVLMPAESFVTVLAK